MATKNQILSDLAKLDDKTLNRLYDYSKVVKMLYPESDLLLQANMAQMLDKAQELARIYLPDWTDRADGDFGQYLVELVALFSEKDFWYNNAFHLESNLSTAKKYSNIFTKAHQQGYDAQLQTASKLDFTLTFQALNSIDQNNPRKEILPGEIIVKQVGGVREFANPHSFFVTDSLSESVVTQTLSEGKFRSNTYEFNGYSIQVPYSDIDPETIGVVIGDVRWSRVRQFGLSGGSDNVFMVLPDRSGAVEIFFGDGTYGKSVAQGTSVQVTCISTSGEDITGIGDFTVKSVPSARLLLAAEAQASFSTGAAKKETAETIKIKAITAGRTRNTIINASDCVAFLLDQPNVLRANVIFTNTAITFYVIGQDKLPLPTADLDELMVMVESRMVQLGFSLLKGTPSYVPLPEMDISVDCLPSSNYSAIKAVVQQAAKDFYDPLVLGDFARPFNFNDFYVHLYQQDPNIVRIRINYRNTNTQLPEVLPLLSNEIIQTPVVVDGESGQNIFVTAQSV